MCNRLRDADLAVLLLTVLLPALAGCANPHQQELAAFLAQPHVSAPCPQYRLMPPDEIRITARPAEEYQGLVVRLGPDGQAQLPLLGPCHLAGKTTDELSAELRQRLGEFYQDVQVTVNVTAYNSQRYYIFGHVNHPGSYPCTGSNTLLQALAVAQPNSMADKGKVQLVRGQGLTQGGFLPDIDTDGHITPSAQRLTIDMDRMVQQGDLSANVLLAHNDVIYVPAHPLAKAGLAIHSVLFPVRPAIEAVGVPSRMSLATAP